MHKIEQSQIESALRSVRRLLREAQQLGNDPCLLERQKGLLRQAQAAISQDRVDDAVATIDAAMDTPAGVWRCPDE